MTSLDQVSSHPGGLRAPGEQQPELSGSLRLQNLPSVTSSTFYWSKQITVTQIEGTEKQAPTLGQGEQGHIPKACGRKAATHRDSLGPRRNHLSHVKQSTEHVWHSAGGL